MKRRAFLATGLSAGVTATAGCLVGYQETEAVGEPEPTEYSGIAAYGFPSTICDEELRPDAIRAIDDPAFAPDWSGVDLPEEYHREGGLTDDRVIVGIAGERVTRAYPLSVLKRHEVVNDRFDVPVLVTYCPICRSGLVARREVDGEEATFGVEEGNPDSAIRDSANLVLYDEPTRSRWSQLLAEAICGPKTGERLAILPSTVATWGEWHTRYPDTDVLLPPPRSGTMDPPVRLEG